MKMKMVSISLTKMSILLILISLTILGCGNQRHESSIGVGLVADWLWSPFSEDLEEWQVVLDASDMVRGPEQSLIVCDRRGSRVFRIDLAGNLLEEIGKKGPGPSEFQYPTYLSYSSYDGSLLIADKSKGTIIRYVFTRGQFVFSSSHRAPIARTLEVPSLVIDGVSRFWSTGFSAGARIRLNRLDGEVLREFGEPWIVPGLEPLLIDLLNRSLLLKSSPDTLIYVWRTRKQIEKWTVSGQLAQEQRIAARELSTIDSIAAKSYDTSKIGNSYIPYYFTWADAPPETRSVYVGLVPVPNLNYTVYKFHADNLKVSTRLQVVQGPEKFHPVKGVVFDSDGDFRIFILDKYTGGILCLRVDQ